jgi:hypothetical protein
LNQPGNSKIIKFKIQKKTNKPAKIDAVVELVLLILPLVAAAALTQIDGSTHEQKSWHDDRKDFLDPGRHVMRCRGSFSKARKTGKSIEQLQQQPSPSCPGFLFFFKFFKKNPLAILTGNER